MKRFLGLVAIATSFFMSAGPAQAATTFDANLAAPGVYFGSGNPNGGFTVNTQNGVEMAIRGKVYQGAVPTPIGNVYNIALGNVASWDWSFNPSVIAPVSLAGLQSLMTITNVATGGSFSFNPFLVPDNATNVLAPGGFQNSWRMSFGFLNGVGGIGYNSNVDSTYRVDWTTSGSAFGTLNNTIFVNQGAGAPAAVPEPSTWMLLLFGFGVVGYAMRRRSAVSGYHAMV